MNRKVLSPPPHFYMVALLCCVVRTEAHAQSFATTDGGRRVQLNLDGTWTWADLPQAPGPIDTTADNAEFSPGPPPLGPSKPDTTQVPSATVSSESLAHPAAAPTPSSPVAFAQDAVSVVRVALTEEPEDDYGRDSVSVCYGFENHADVPVTGVVTSLTIRNPFGTILLTTTDENEVAISPNSKQRNSICWSYEDNPFREREPYDRMWKVARDGTAKIEVEVEKVALSDGRILTARPATQQRTKRQKSKGRR